MSGEPQSVLRIVRGRPDESEVAAVTVLLAVAASGADVAGTRRRAGSVWGSQGWRRPTGAWRAAGRPAA